jgi:alpha-D-xyloside xylohydrolase
MLNSQGLSGGQPTPVNFRVVAAESPGFQELLVRWCEYSTFCPVLRMHGTRTCHDKQGVAHCPNEPWSFGESVVRHLTTMLWLWERMRPYIMEQMKIASTHGVPVQRPLWFDYEEDDPTVTELEPYTFLFGDDLLVAPIVHSSRTSRDVHLPRNSNWIVCWRENPTSPVVVVQGGKWLYNVSAPLGRPPLFIRTQSSTTGIPVNPLLSQDLCMDQAGLYASYGT